MRFNFNHLYYFWEVVRQGGVSQAAEVLHLTPQTISGQLKQFQEYYPEPLLVRAGRRLQLSSLGECIFEQANAMFMNKDTLIALMDRSSAPVYRRLRIGAADVLPKISVRRLLAPSLHSQPRPLLSVREVDLAALLEDLALRRLDAVIADRPVATAGHARVQSQLLMTSELAIYAAEPLANQLTSDFPSSLDGAPALLPGPANYLRRLLDRFFHEINVHPEVVGEMEDSALVSSFGEAGFGFFAAPVDQREMITKQYRVNMIGRCEGIEEQFYVITLEHGPLNPAVNEWLAKVNQSMKTVRNEDI